MNINKIKIARELVKLAKEIKSGKILGPGIPDGTGPCYEKSKCPINADFDENYIRVEYGDDNLRVTLEIEDDGRYEVEVSKKYENNEWKKIEEYYFDTEDDAHEKFNKIVESF